MFGLTASQWLKVGFLLLKGANWAMGQVDQRTWKNAGYAEAVAEQNKRMASWIDEANRVRAETAQMSDAQITDDLDKSGEFRKD